VQGGLGAGTTAELADEEDYNLLYRKFSSQQMGKELMKTRLVGLIEGEVEYSVIRD